MLLPSTLKEFQNLLGSVAVLVAVDELMASQQGVQVDIRTKLGKMFPAAPENDKILKAWRLAEAGKQEDLYSTDYILYCNFVHATLRLANPWPDEMHGSDILAVSRCLRLALMGMESIGGPKIPPALAAKLELLDSAP